MNKTYLIKAVVEVKARSLESVYKKLDFIQKRKSLKFLHFEYAGAVKK